MSETAPTDSTVKPAPPVAPEPLEDDDDDDDMPSFEDSQIKLDPEALGLKVGKPILEEEAPAAQEPEASAEETPVKAETAEKAEEHEHPGHDEL